MPVSIKRVGEALAVSIKGVDDFAGTLDKVKSIPGRRWNPDAKVWELPDEPDTLMQAAEILRPVLSAELKAELQGAAEAIADDLVTRAGKDAELMVPWASQLFPFQRAGVDFAIKYPAYINADDMGLGKGGTVDSRILTPEGWTTYGEVRVGDRVIGSDGRPTEVTGVFPRGWLDVFRVTFSDGVSTVVDGEHLWAVKTPNDRARGGDWRTVETHNLLPTHDAAGNRRWSIPLVEPVAFDLCHTIPIAPYTLGAFLGDGSFRGSDLSISCPDQHVIDRLHLRGSDTIALRKSSGGLTWGISGGATKNALRELGLDNRLSIDKFIPEPYLRQNPHARLALLHGLMDTDGYCQRVRDDGPGTSAEIAVSSSRLADGIQELVWSLGGTAHRRIKQTTHEDSHRITVKLPAGMNPFSLPRKAEGYAERTKYPLGRYIQSVEPEGQAEVVCISVAAEDSLYVTEDYIVTHNTLQSITAVEEYHWRRVSEAQGGIDLNAEVGEDTYRNGPVLVICPNTIRDNWKREIEDGPNPELFDRSLWPELKATVIDGRTPAKRKEQAQEAIKRNDYLVVNWEKLRRMPELQKVEWAGIIADEAHRAKNRKSKQSEALRKLKAPVKISATGTPIMNSPDELWPLLNWIDRKTYSSYWRFFNMYVESYEGYRGSKVITGVRNADKLRFELKDKLIRRTKKQVLDDFPDKLPEQVIEVEMLPKQKKAYVAAQNEFLLNVEEAMRDPEVSNDKKRSILAALQTGDIEYIGREVDNAAARMSFMRQIATSPALMVDDNGEPFEDISSKLDAVVEKIGDHPGKPFVVACWHKRAAEVLAERLSKQLKINVAFLHGDVHPDERAKHVQEFQDGKLDVLIGTIAVAGVGITLTRADTIIFIEEDWVPANNRQMEDRIYRVGQKNDVTVIKYRSKDTVDTLDIAPANRLKQLIESAVYGDEE
jgi:superfamily II DNA or RNA helicase